MKKSPSVVYWLGSNLYLNITNKCSNNCYFCIRNFKSGVGNFNLKLSKEPSTEEILDDLLKVLNRKNWREIVFCGFGEPLERLDCLLEVTRWIRKHYGKPVSIRVDTNGQGFLLNKSRDITTELKAEGVNKLSVSLNAHDKETYNQVCKPKFEDAFENVLTFIEKAKGKFDVEITAVTISEVDLSKVAKIAQQIGVKFRAREYIPGFW
ncbi:MAG: TatD family nuclease-associated radical SAM protein [Candidatus Bathyarchaeota archaeon]|nr:radical SAM protein [Candidatus Bathyarchaeota archaeon A05DMB-5]MDH7557576.1 TatD family nuclease-associated radical SAM protein [Candidatus Bathyarchaeota archaeon]